MRRHLLAVGLIAAATLAAYAGALSHGFVWDDHEYVESNAFVQDPRNLRVLLDPRYYLGTHEVLVGHRPVFLASLMLDRAAWGARPAGYHATNLLLHAADAAWIYALSLALALPPPIPLLSGLFFALHPIQTEAVNLVSFRADLLAAFFVFFSLWIFLRARTARGVGTALAACAASAALFGLGLLSKESAAALPLLVLLVELYFPAPNARRLRLGAAMGGYALVACLYAGFWSPRFHYHGMAEGSPLRAAVDRFASAMPTAPRPGGLALGVEKGLLYRPSPWEWNALSANPRAWTATMIKTFAAYFRLLAFPHPLVADRAPLIAGGLTEPAVLLSLALLILVAVYAAWARRRQPLAGFGAAWTLAALLPVTNVLPLYLPMAERYLYLPAAGFAWALAFAFERLGRGFGARARRGALFAAAGVACLYAAGVVARSADWTSDRALFLSGTGLAPQSSMAHANRAGIYRQDRRFAFAIGEYLAAVRQRPDYAEAWLGLGASYGALGNGADSDAAFARALALAPDTPIMPLAYGLALARAGRPEKAVEQFRRSLAIEPRSAEAWLDLGTAYRDLGRAAQSRAAYEKAAALAPGDPLPPYFLGTLMEKTGDRRSAERLYRAALARDRAFQPAQDRLAGLSARPGKR